MNFTVQPFSILFPFSCICSELVRFIGFPHSSVGKESTCNAGDPSSIPGLGRSAGKGIGYPLQYSWASLVTQLVKNLPAVWETWVQSLSWEEPWRRERLPTPVFWPGEFHGLYSPWGHKELDTTEQLNKKRKKKRITIRIAYQSIKTKNQETDTLINVDFVNK